MAKLQVVGTGSRQGNTYLLKTSKQILVLDLGCKWSEIKESLNYDLSDVTACLVTHRHSDHTKSISAALKYRLPVYSCQDVAGNFIGVIPLQLGKKYRIGEFFVQPFHVEHNVECYSYLIENEEIGRMLFMSDCTSFPYKIKNVNHLLIEANYSEDIVIDHLCKNEEVRSNNQYHMEIGETVECVKRLFSGDLSTVCLIHLSDGQSDEEAFKKRIYEAVGIMPYVANKGLEIELNKEDF